jgi:hypothetical protein
VDSLKRSGFVGTTALLVDRSNLALRDYLTGHGIEVVLLDSPPRWMPDWIARRRFNGGRVRFFHEAVARFARLLPALLRDFYAVHLAAAFHHISNSRYFYYLDFLQANAHRFSHVLLTDVRDVAFQSDPFEGVPAECLWFFQECTRHTLGSEPSNRFWIQTAYGTEGLERIQQNGILCSGTTVGSTGLVIKYLRRMTGEVIRLTPVIRGAFGYDQAAQNWLYWTGLFPEAEIKQNFLGPVATLHLEPPGQFEFDGLGRLLNRDGKPAPVLHQYDRFPAVTQRLTACQITTLG